MDFTLQIFEALFARMAHIAEGTRNAIDAHHDIQLLNSHQRDKPTEQKRIAVVNHILSKRPGFTVHGAWHVLTSEEARLVLRKALTDSVAYDWSELTKVEQSMTADHIVADFFRQFKDLTQTTFLTLWFRDTNNTFRPRQSPGILGRLTPSTFGSGLVAIDGEKLAYIWFEETD